MENQLYEFKFSDGSYILAYSEEEAIARWTGYLQQNIRLAKAYLAELESKKPTIEAACIAPLKKKIKG